MKILATKDEMAKLIRRCAKECDCLACVLCNFCNDEDNCDKFVESLVEIVEGADEKQK